MENQNHCRSIRQAKLIACNKYCMDYSGKNSKLSRQTLHGFTCTRQEIIATNTARITLLKTLIYREKPCIDSTGKIKFSSKVTAVHLEDTDPEIINLFFSSSFVVLLLLLLLLGQQRNRLQLLLLLLFFFFFWNVGGVGQILAWSSRQTN